MEKLPVLLTCCRRLNMLSPNRLAFCLTQYASVQHVQSRLAGHSHWDNIRHSKGAKDAAKGAISQQLSTKVRIAIRDGGGANPKINTKLAKVIELAEKNNIPNKSIQTMIDRAIASKSTDTRFEVKGPSGSFLILDMACERPKKSKNDVNRVLAKHYGGTIMSAGATTNYFADKGIIIASVKESKPMSLEEAEDIAISVDAEDVKLDSSEGDAASFQITCEPNMLYNVVKKLDETDLDVLDFNVMPIATERVELNVKEKTAVDAAIQRVRSFEDVAVENVYDNIQW